MSEILKYPATDGQIFQAFDRWYEAQKRDIIQLTAGIHELHDLVESARQEGTKDNWSKVCGHILHQDFCRGMSQSHIGLWSHIRLKAGGEWSGVPTLTRGLAHHIQCTPQFAINQLSSHTPYGMGAVAIIEDKVWIADHLFFAGQDFLETGLDGRFYGYHEDPHLSSIEKINWMAVMRKWAEVVSAGDLSYGWLQSPRWLLPIPVTGIPRKVLQEGCEPSRLLWRSVLDVSAICQATLIKDIAEHRCWWELPGAIPEPQDLPRWSSTVLRHSGFQVINEDTLLQREKADPMVLPMLLHSIGMGEPQPSRQAWRLIKHLTEGKYAPAAEDQDDEFDKFEKYRAKLDRVGDVWLANTWAFCDVLTEVELVPRYNNLNQVHTWPPTTILKSGLWRLLKDYAHPVVAQEEDLKVHDLKWSWDSRGPACPKGYRIVSAAETAPLLMDQTWMELRGGFQYVI